MDNRIDIVSNNKLNINILDRIFYTYLVFSPVIVIFITLINFNKGSFYFYLFSVLISGIYLTVELYRIREINYRVILYVVLIFMLIYQITFFLRSIAYFQNYIFIQFLLISITYIIFLNRLNLFRIKEFILDNYRLIILIYSTGIFFYTVLFITKLGFKTVWGSSYFQAYFEFPHQASYEFFVFQGIGLMLYLLSNNKVYKYLTLLIITVAVILNSFTGARTSFILSLIVFIPFLYRYFKKNRKVLFILLGIIITFIVLNYFLDFIDIENIPIIKKFIHSSSGRNHLFTSREFWDDLMIYWKDEYTFREFVLGKGFGVSIYINGLIGFKGLWSHNDFIELILSMGIIGLVYYIWLIISLVYKYKDYILLVIIIGFGFLNGFFAYAYIFSCIPVYLLTTQLFRNKEKIMR